MDSRSKAADNLAQSKPCWFVVDEEYDDDPAARVFVWAPTKEEAVAAGAKCLDVRPEFLSCFDAREARFTYMDLFLSTTAEVVVSPRGKVELKATDAP